MHALKTVRIYDPAMCCSTGVCGPSVEPELARFAADLEWLRREGARVERFNLAQEPAAFAAEPLVRHALQERGEDVLPLVIVEGVVRSSGVYPARDVLATWAGVGAARLPEKRRTALPVGQAPGSACCGPAAGAPGTEGSCC